MTAPETSLLGRLTAADPERAYHAARTRLDALDATDPDGALVALRVVCMRALALAAKELGRLTEGLRALRTALKMAESAGHAHAAAQVRMNLVGLLAAAGDIKGALATAERAEPLLDGLDADRLTANRVCALARGGHLDEALSAARRVLPGLRDRNDPVTLAGLLVNVALIRSLKGEVDTAESVLTEAVTVASELPHLAALARCNLAFVASRRGDLPRALELYASVEPVLTGERAAQCRLDHAGALIDAGLPVEAQALLKATLAEIGARGYDCDVADGQLLLAHAELAAGDAEQAAVTAEGARALFGRQERTGWMLLAEHLLLRARWAAGDRTPVFFRSAVATADRLEQGGWAEAAADARIIAARVALELGRPVDDLLHSVGEAHSKGPAALRAAAWHATALAREAKGDRRGATAAVWAGLQVVSDHADVFGAAELRARAGGLGTDLTDLGIKMARSGRELLAAEERRRALLRRPLAACPPADPVLAGILTELRAASAEHAAAVAGGADTVEHAERLERLEAAVRLRSRGKEGTAADPTWPPPADLPAELAAELGDRVLVELIRTGDDLQAVIIVDGRCRRRPLGDHADAVTATRLLRFELHRLARHCAGTPEPDPSGLAHARDALERQIIGPLRDLLGDRELVIAPTGALHGVPWPSLPSLAGRPLTVVPSAASWLRARSARAGHRNTRTRVALVAGPGLRHADTEITQIARLYPGATVLHGPAARTATVHRALDGAALAHLAAHGEFRSGNALFSHLAMEDGPLMAYDLECLRTPPPLVVLSACDAGQADAGDAVMGIVSVLLAFGTATVIASVTPIRDAAAPEFMASFHRLLRGGTSPARALAAVPRTHGVLGFVCFGAG